jgi:adenylate cyclase
MLIRAALQAFILVLILLTATFLPGFLRSIYHYRLPVRAALAAFSVFVAYELFAAGLLTTFIRRGRNFPVLGRYVNTFVETSFPTLLLYLLAGSLFAPAVFETWTALLYFSSLFSRRCGLILRFRPSPERSPQSRSSPLPWSPCTSSGESEDPDFSIGYHLTRSAVLLAAGRLASYVGATIKSHFRRALARRVGSRRSDQSLRSGSDPPLGDDRRPSASDRPPPQAEVPS